MGGSVGRVATGIASGGLSEIARAGQGYLPNKTVPRALLGYSTGGLSELGQPNPFQSNPKQNTPQYAPPSTQDQMNQYENMFQTGQGYGGNDKGAVAYKAFREVNGRPPSVAELGNALNTSATGLDSYALDSARPMLEQEGQRQSGQTSQLGQSQYDQSLKGINDIGTANTQRASDLFKQMLPNIAENAQAAHLYDSTGYGQEVARQQSNIASQVANQEAQLRLGALGQLQGTQTNALGQQQGFQTGGLQRFTGLQDYATQANLAKQLGQAAVPSVGKGGGTGALRGGASGAAAGAGFGAPGAAIGGSLGAILGGLSPSSGGK